MKFRDEIEISDNELYNRNSVMQNLFNNSAEYNNMQQIFGIISKKSGITRDIKEKIVTQTAMCKRNQYISNPLISNVFRYEISEPDRSEEKYID